MNYIPRVEEELVQNMQTGISGIMGNCVLFQANGIKVSSRFTYARAKFLQRFVGPESTIPFHMLLAETYTEDLNL
jgi:hypothetical protein